MAAGRMICLFCNGVVLAKNGNLNKFKNHVEDVHDITVRFEFLVGLHFLSEAEIDILSSKLGAKVEVFVESLGETSSNSNIFDSEKYVNTENQNGDNSKYNDTYEDKDISDISDENSDNIEDTKSDDLKLTVVDDQEIREDEVTELVNKYIMNNKDISIGDSKDVKEDDLRICTDEEYINPVDYLQDNTTVKYELPSGITCTRLSIDGVSMDQDIEINKSESEDLNSENKLQQKTRGRNPFVQCDFCRKVVKQYNLNQHMLTHTVKSEECKLCYKKFTVKAYLKKHYEVVHVNDSHYIEKELTEADLKYKCDSCDKGFVTEYLLNSHHKSHEQTDERTCGLCLVLFKSSHTLLAHKKTVHKSELDAFDQILEEKDLKVTCFGCEKMFYSENAQHHHAARQHKEENETGCKLCFIKFKTSYGLDLHKMKIHSKELNAFNTDFQESDLIFKCDFCNKTYYTEISQKYHMSKKHYQQHKNSQNVGSCPLKVGEFGCKLCFMKFKNSHGFQLHKMKIHKKELAAFDILFQEKDLKFKCNFCSKKYYTEISQMHHMNRKHYQQNKRIKNGQLTKTQTGEASCKLCVINFKNAYGFELHKTKIHFSELGAFKIKFEENDMKFKCNFCNKKYFTEISQRHHMTRKHYQQNRRMENGGTLKVNTGEKNCKLCFISFKNAYGFEQHKVKIHSDEMDAFNKTYEVKDLKFKCNFCKRTYYTEISQKHHMSKKHYTQYKNRTDGLSKDSKNCQLCRIGYKKTIFLEAHKKKAHTEEMEAFNKAIKPEDLKSTCRLCEQKYYSQNTLNLHIKRKHTTTTRTRPYCQLCHTTLKQADSLTKHYQFLHKHDIWALEEDIDVSLFSYNCKLCNKNFIREELLNNHVGKEHRQTPSIQTYCRLCYVDFKFPSHLKYHIEKIHKSKEEVNALNGELKWDSLSFMCKYCDEQFLTKNILKYHNTYNHREEKRQDLHCELCNKVFKWKYTRKTLFENHMRMAHGVKEIKLEEDKFSEENNYTVDKIMKEFDSM